MSYVDNLGVGNYSNTALWPGGVVPVAPMQPRFVFSMTIDVDADIGHSPASNDAENAYVVNAGVTLTIANGKRFRSRGDGDNKGLIDILGGGGITYDASNAADPTTTVYQTKQSATGSKIRMRGIFGVRSYLETYKGVGGTNANGKSTNSNYCGDLDLQYGRISNMGDGTTFPFLLMAAGIGAAVRTNRIERCLFDGCGTLSLQAAIPPNADSITSIKSNWFVNGVGANGDVYFNSNLAAAKGTNGVREFIGNVTTRATQSGAAQGYVNVSFRDMTVDNNVITGLLQTPALLASNPTQAASYGALASVSGNISRILYAPNPGSLEVAYMGPNFWWVDTGAGGFSAPPGNFHGFKTTANVSHVIEKQYWQVWGVDNGANAENGDLMILGFARAAVTAAYRQCVQLLTRWGGQAGSMFSAGGSADLTVIEFNHCTTGISYPVPGNGSEMGLCHIGESYTGRANFFAEGHGHLGHRLADGTTPRTTGGALISRYSACTVTDLITPSGVHSNAVWRGNSSGAIGTSGVVGQKDGFYVSNSAATPLFSGAVGAGDISGIDPMFDNPWTNMAVWSRALRGLSVDPTQANHDADCTAAWNLLLLSLDEVNANPNATLTNLLAKIASDLTPRNPAFLAYRDAVTGKAYGAFDAPAPVSITDPRGRGRLSGFARLSRALVTASVAAAIVAPHLTLVRGNASPAVRDGADVIPRRFRRQRAA